MIFRGETRDEYWSRVRKQVARWEIEDARKIAKILPRWRQECEWHDWFAWFPVEIGDGQTVWLQTIQRRLRFRDQPRIMATWNVRSYEYAAAPKKQ